MNWYSSILAMPDIAQIFAENWWEKPGPLGIPMGMFFLFMMYLNSQNQARNQRAQNQKQEKKPHNKQEKTNRRVMKKATINQSTLPEQEKKQNASVPPKIMGNRCSNCGGEVKSWNGKPRCLSCGTLRGG